MTRPATWAAIWTQNKQDLSGGSNSTPIPEQAYANIQAVTPRPTSLPAIEWNYTLVGAIGNILSLSYCIIIIVSKIKGIGCLRGSRGHFVYSCFYALGEWGCWSRSSAPISPKPLYRGLSPVAPILHIESPTGSEPFCLHLATCTTRDYFVDFMAYTAFLHTMTRQPG